MKEIEDILKFTLEIFREKMKRVCPSLFTRPMTKYIKSQKKSDLIGIEIGSFVGDNAENIFLKLSIKKLYLIDPYEPYVEDGKISNRSSSYNVICKRLKKYGKKVELIKKRSIDAIDDVPNDIDFIYIDGNHTYAFVKKDIELYYPKLKTYGILGGHDFSLSFPGVVSAVIEFAKKHDLKLFGADADWWVIKNG